jgi:error-prone DNA polymerase
MPLPYVELHCHSGFSFLDGASHPEELVLRAAELGYPALALTDHDGLYGSMEFARAARDAGIQPVTGAEVTLQACFPGRHEPDVGHHVTLLAETPRGYANLSRLLTEAHLGAEERGDPRLPLPRLLERNEGLILLTGCRRSPLLAALDSSVADGEAFLARLVEAFGPDRVFAELQDNAVKGDADRVRALGRLVEGTEVGVVATGNVHYHRPERHRLQDVLVAIGHRTTLDGAHAVRRPNRLFHLASPGEMARRFRSRPEALTNTLLIAERCAAFDLTEDLGYEFPDFEGSQRGGALETLAALCLAEIGRRYEPGSAEEREAEERLHAELRLVDLHGLAGFFLVYRDIMELAREVAAEVRSGSPRAGAGLPPGRGRGSSVSSIICYLIGLSHIDPVETDLFLGRFLNEALRSVPDIDLDFPRDIREELILRVYERYGHEHTGLVCTFPTYRLRSAVREIGKALDLPPGELEKLAKLAESRSAAGLADEIASLPEFRDRADAPLWRMLGELAGDVSGLPRHISQHVGGMIISSRPLVEMVPLEPAAWEGRFLCQWDKDSCEDAGFIKIDFLALGMLSLVEDAVDLVAEAGTAGAGGEPVVGGAPDLSRIDFDDPVVYDRICSGDTVGLFQVESRAQIQMVRRTRPRNLRELAIQVAIVRPGPIVGGAVNPFVRRREMLRQNPEYEIPYPHPLLEEPLAETLGVIIYQDQVLTVCKALAGFSDGQAESLRRAMSRKRSREAMTAHWEEFRDGALARGVDETTAREVFQQVTAFSEFGFPKSHAAAFGLLAYQSAWLREYYPLEYYVALFNNQPMGFYSLDALGRDARRNGVRTLLPDVNRSRMACTPEDGSLRIGLGFIRGWGTDVAEAVVAERDARGAFRSLVDFLRRTPASLKRPAVENLIWVGGFEGFGLTRRELLWQAGLWLGPESDGGRRGGREDHAQTELGLEEPYAALAFRDLEARDRMVAEYRMLHFSAELHPLSLLADQLPDGTVTSDRLRELPQHATVRVAGLVTARQRPGTAKGYVFVLMEDEAGPVNVIVKPDVYERDRSVVRMEPFLAVRGRLQKDGDSLNVIAFQVEALRVPAGPSTGPAAGGAGAGTTPGDGRSGRDGRDETRSRESEAPERGAVDAAALHDSLPDTLEYWADPDRKGPSPFRYLTALRQSPPDVKSFG